MNFRFEISNFFGHSRYFHGIFYPFQTLILSFSILYSKLMHTQNTINFLTILHTVGWRTTKWRAIGAPFFALLFQNTCGVRCVRKMSDLNLRYGSRRYFTCNPGHFYVTCITDRASLYYFPRWNLFWKYIIYVYKFSFFFSSIIVRNYEKLDTEKCMKCIRKKKEIIPIEGFRCKFSNFYKWTKSISLEKYQIQSFIPPSNLPRIFL